MSYRAIYAARRESGRCVTCGGRRSEQMRCKRCAEKHREQNRTGYVRRLDRAALAQMKAGWRQTADLAEAQAFKKGGAILGKEESIPLASPRPDLSFIRAQSPRAIPLLAKLYSVSEDKIRLIRGSSLTCNRGDRMPLKLLEELVEQRTGKYHIDHFIQRDSPIVLCAEG